VRNGFKDVEPNTLTLNIPPESGPQAGNASAVEVIIERRAPAFFSKALGIAFTTVRARAVVSFDAAEACVLALSTTASRALNITGSTTINAPGCTLASNSTASDAVKLGGSASLAARSIATAGEIVVSGSISVDEPMLDHQPAVADPYADLEVPPVGACTANNFKVTGSGDVTINPGVYCGGISMSGSGTLYLNKGTYILNKGDFSMTGSGRIRCGNCTSPTDGVTIILTATSGQVGSVSIAGSGDVELSAPSDEGNPYQGIVFFQDPKATAGNDAKFNGGSAMKISGGIYLPKADISYTGSNSFATGKNCVEIIGLTIEMTGNSGLNLADCKDMGVKEIDVLRALTLRE
jgi:hypothetical protein